MRAIAEMNTGELYMATRFVKAWRLLGPAGQGHDSGDGEPGQDALSRRGRGRTRKPALAQLMISHPNNSGLVMDQLTRMYTPAYFVRRIQVSYAGQPVLSADVDFSISENPNFRFYFVPTGEGELKAEVVDTNDLRFETVVKVGAGT